MTAPHPLAQVDLNLLVYLDLLLQERSVTRAALRAGITQSAMSRALQRLRDRLEDPVLVPVGRGMEPTERARLIHGSLRDVLGRIHNDVLAPHDFHPALSPRRFSVAILDSLEGALVSRLLERITRSAPAVDLDVRPSGPEALRALEDAHLDLMVDAAPAQQAALHTQTISRQRFVVLARKGHPGIKKKKGINLERFVAYPHIAVAEPTREHVERALAEVDRPRRIAIRVHRTGVALECLERTDALLVLPESLARHHASTRSLIVAEAPVELPELEVSLVWHSRTHGDLGQRWLREQVAEITRAL
ncbi:MAG: LysR family transcriptional regulator [Myxococcota bacterium]